MIKYKEDILSELKSKGYTTYRLRQEKLISEKCKQQIRHAHVTIATLDKLSTQLDCQPGEILEYVPDNKI